MATDLLLAEQLALVSIGAKFPGGVGDPVQLCIAALFIGEVVLLGHAQTGNRDKTIIRSGNGTPSSDCLAAALNMIDGYGPKITSILGQMLQAFPKTPRRPWDTALLGLVEAGAIARPGVGPYPHVTDNERRDGIAAGLAIAISTDGPIETPTALILAVTHGAELLRLVTSGRTTRHSRHRAEHAVDGTSFEPIVKAVRRQTFIHRAMTGG